MWGRSVKAGDLVRPSMAYALHVAPPGSGAPRAFIAWDPWAPDGAHISIPWDSVGVIVSTAHPKGPDGARRQDARTEVLFPEGLVRVSSLRLECVPE